MPSIKRRLERLETARKHRGVPIIIVNYWETYEEVYARELAERPYIAQAKVIMVINCQGPAGPGGSPPPRPQSPERERIPTPPRPLAITK